MKKFVIQHLWWVTLLLALGMLLAHSFSLDTVRIDNTSVVLLLVIFLSPFISAIKKIKVGEFEAEIDSKEVQKIKEDVETQLPEPESGDEPVPEIQNTISNIIQLVETDPVIALAKLRIELEKVLNKIYRLTHKEDEEKRPLSVGRLVYDLSSKEILPQGVSGPIREVVSICNRAVHGEEIREKDAKSIIEIGTSLLERLYWNARGYVLEPSDKMPIEHSELDAYRNAQYRLTTVIPYVEKPVKNVRIVNQDELYDFIEGYSEYAEFIVDITKIDTEDSV